MPVPAGYTVVPAQYLYKLSDQSGPYILDASGNAILLGGTGSTAGEVQGNIASGSADSGKPVKVGGKYNSSLPTIADAQRGDLQITDGGVLRVALAGTLAAGADGLTNAGIIYPTSANASASSSTTRTGSVVAPVLYNGSTWDRARGDTNGAYTVSKGVTSGGLSAARVFTGTVGTIKASAGQLYSLLSVRNANAAVRYLHLYNKATDPTLSTDTPIITISLAASSVQNEITFGANIGLAFSTGIAWAYTTDNIAIPATAATSTELMFSVAYA